VNRVNKIHQSQNQNQPPLLHKKKEKREIMSEATPRITAPYLEQFSHRTVRILGKVTQLRGEQATIDSGGSISVHLNRVILFPSHPSLDASSFSLILLFV